MSAMKPQWYLLVQIRTVMGQRDANYVLFGLVKMDDLPSWGFCSGGKRRTKVATQVDQQSQSPPPGHLPWPLFQTSALPQRVLLPPRPQKRYQPAIFQARSRCCCIFCPAELSRCAHLIILPFLYAGKQIPPFADKKGP